MKSSTDEISCRRQLAVEAARAAGRETLSFFRKAELSFEYKSDHSPVTEADRRAETFLRQQILDEFPGDGILGEEFPEHPGSTGYRWILDPIDGTKSFISGVPLYGTLVAVEHDGQNVVGVIDIPALDEHIYAEVGQGAWYARGSDQVKRAKVASTEHLREGLLLTSELDGWVGRGTIEQLNQLAQIAWFTRTWGDCYGYLLVATGRALAMIDPAMKLWDAAALQPIVEEAGGTFTDWQGTPTVHSGEGIATNGRVLDEILSVTRDI